MNSAELPKACVVIGAGASYDAWNGITGRREEWQPPLASELFGPRREFESLLGRYPGASQLGQELSRLAANPDGAFSIEKQLLEYANHPDRRVRDQFRQVPPYLRDVIAACQLGYLQTSSAHAVFVKKLLADHPHQVAFVVLNYDTYVEAALTALDETMTFHNMDDYAALNRQAIVVKPHGSIDWLVEFAAPQLSWERSIATHEESPRSPVYIRPPASDPRSGVDQMPDLRGPNQGHLYPLITAPLAGKGENDVVCPDEHIIAFKQWVADCSKFLIVGTSGLDSDVLQLLDAAVSRALLVEFVGNGIAAGESRTRFNEGVRAIRSCFKDSVRKEGFMKYVFSNDFVNFLSWRPSSNLGPSF